MADVAMRDTPEHWRERARQARADASLHADPEIKKTMLEIAALYEELVTLAEKRASPKAS
jgi:hypothetical protein